MPEHLRALTKVICSTKTIDYIIYFHYYKEFRNIFISPDRTRQEREMFRVLRDDLKRRKSNGETNLVIRNDKIIVKVSHSVMTLVQFTHLHYQLKYT